MSNGYPQKIHVDVDWDAVGEAAGDAVARKLKGTLEDIGKQLKALATAQKKVAKKIKKNTKEVKRNTEEVGALKRKITDIERAKAKAKMALDNVSDMIEKFANEARAAEEDEEEEIRNDYDETMMELLREFVKDIRNTHTGNLDSIKKEFGYLTDLKESMLEDTLNLYKFHHFYYNRRSTELGTKRRMVIQTITDFLERRENIKGRIEAFKTKIPVRSPSVFFYPFWLIGVTNEYGNEEYHTYPVQQRSSLSGAPTSDDPYVEHLDNHRNFDITSDISGPALHDELLDPQLIDKGRALSILPEIHDLRSELGALSDEGFFNRDFLDTFFSYYETGKFHDTTSSNKMDGPYLQDSKKPSTDYISPSSSLSRSPNFKAPGTKEVKYLPSPKRKKEESNIIEKEEIIERINMLKEMVTQAKKDVPLPFFPPQELVEKANELFEEARYNEVADLLRVIQSEIEETKERYEEVKDRLDSCEDELIEFRNKGHKLGDITRLFNSAVNILKDGKVDRADEIIKELEECLIKYRKDFDNTFVRLAELKSFLINVKKEGMDVDFEWKNFISIQDILFDGSFDRVNEKIQEIEASLEFKQGGSSGHKKNKHPQNGVEDHNKSKKETLLIPMKTVDQDNREDDVQW